MMNNLEKIRLALTEAGLAEGWLTFSHEWPKPINAVWTDGAAVVQQSTGGTAFRGAQSFQIIWNDLNTIHVRQIRELIEAALNGAGLIYATINKAWRGAGNPDHWVDVTVIPSIPQVAPQNNSNAALIGQLVVNFASVTTVNDPAVF